MHRIKSRFWFWFNRFWKLSICQLHFRHLVHKSVGQDLFCGKRIFFFRIFRQTIFVIVQLFSNFFCIVVNKEKKWFLFRFRTIDFFNNRNIFCCFVRIRICSRSLTDCRCGRHDLMELLQTLVNSVAESFRSVNVAKSDGQNYLGGSFSSQNTRSQSESVIDHA